jgi:hypothetical protein
MEKNLILLYVMTMNRQGLPHPVPVHVRQRMKCLSMSVGMLF